MATLWDYFSYGPQNPVLSAVSAAGQKTGVQTYSKKVLNVASEAGKPFRAALGYGEKYNITQAQAGEIGYIAGTIVGAAGAPKAGASLAGGLSRFMGSEVAEVGMTAPRAAEAADVAANTKKGFSLSNVVSKLPSVSTTAKVVGTGAVVIGGPYLAYKGVTGLGNAIDQFFGGGGTKKDPGNGNGNVNYWPPNYQPPTINIPPGGGGGNPLVVYPPGVNPYNPDWTGTGGPGGSAWGDLAAGLGSLPAGAGSGIQDIGAGVGSSIVPIALVAGVVLLGSEYMGKGKHKGKK